MLKIAQITDTHLLPPGEKLMGLDVVARLERVLDHARRFDPDAYFFTGDFCAREPKEWVFEWLKPRLEALGKPYRVIPGNHDDRAMMRRHLDLPGVGDEPILQTLTIGGRHFIFLDTRYAEIDEPQTAWLETELIDHPNASVVMHHPPLPLGQPFMDNNYAMKNTGELLRVLRSASFPVHIFCGHYHGCRTLFDDNLAVHLCPPTSFFIKPEAEVFEQDFLPPAYQQVTFTRSYQVRVAPIYLGESPAETPE